MRHWVERNLTDFVGQGSVASAYFCHCCFFLRRKRKKKKSWCSDHRLGKGRGIVVGIVTSVRFGQCAFLEEIMCVKQCAHVRVRVIALVKKSKFIWGPMQAYAPTAILTFERIFEI